MSNKKEEQQLATMPAVEPVARKPQAATFTKEQFLQSRQRSGQEKDILAAVLEDNKAYTIVEANKAIQNYLTKGVK